MFTEVILYVDALFCDKLSINRDLQCALFMDTAFLFTRCLDHKRMQWEGVALAFIFIYKLEIEYRIWPIPAQNTISYIMTVNTNVQHVVSEVDKYIRPIFIFWLPRNFPYWAAKHPVSYNICAL